MGEKKAGLIVLAHTVAGVKKHGFIRCMAVMTPPAKTCSAVPAFLLKVMLLLTIRKCYYW